MMFWVSAPGEGLNRRNLKLQKKKPKKKPKKMSRLKHPRKK